MPAPRARPWKSISEKHAARCVCVWMCVFKEYHQTQSRGETLTLTALIRELDAGDASPQIRAGARGIWWRFVSRHCLVLWFNVSP